MSDDRRVAALAALQAVRSDEPAESEALAWGMGLLAGPLDDVIDFDPRWSETHYRTLLVLGERAGFGVTRAAGWLEEKLGRDAQQTRGRMRPSAEDARSPEVSDGRSRA